MPLSSSHSTMIRDDDDDGDCDGAQHLPLKNTPSRSNAWITCAVSTSSDAVTPFKRATYDLTPLYIENKRNRPAALKHREILQKKKK